MKERKNLGPNSKLNHPQVPKMVEGNKPLISPIYHSAKFTPSEDHPYWDQYIYARITNPTTQELEMSLAEIQGREDCMVVASGIAALSGVFLSVLKSGDHMISFRELYKPARVFVKDYLSRYNIEHSLLSLTQLDELEKAIIPGKTKLIHFESPTNPNLEIADIDLILGIAKKHNVLVSMDGTFAGLHQHTQYPVDLMIHSLTKYGNGHGDVIAGCISGKKELLKNIRDVGIYLGAHLDPQAASLIQRGLKTYMLRYERQTKNAAEIAAFLSTHPKIKKVYYPGLPEHRNHALAKKQMSDMGAVVSFEIAPEVAASAERFCHSLELIVLAASLGSTESLICPTKTFFGTDLPESDRAQMGINSHSVRLSVGLEDAKDLIEDLKKALG